MKMTDEQMISYLRSYAHWTNREPWNGIADRLEELSSKEKLEKQNGH